MKEFESSFRYRLIYVFRINDENHRDMVKIGEATLKTDKDDCTKIVPNSSELNKAAKERINQYTQTAGVGYDLLYTEIAVKKEGAPGKEKLMAFSDHDVHNALKRSNIEVVSFGAEIKGKEWFKCDLETAKKAIAAVKEGRSSLLSSDVSKGKSPIIFRPEQADAIKKTINHLKKGNRMLWNAKMRFGKTLTALEVVKEMGFQKTLIYTHRPDVKDGWYDDFNKIFYDTDYVFGSKTKGERIEDLVDTDKKYVYFASLQDLRGSSAVGGKFDKNEYIFLLDWDFVIIDEAHEGTTTTLGQRVIEAVLTANKDKKTKILELSGTPFKLLSGYNENEIFTWDYIMEQRAKQEWAQLHFGDHNPYEDMPKLEIFTYDLHNVFPEFVEKNVNTFKFKEFFRTWTGDTEKDGGPMQEGAEKGGFVHKDAVVAFLNLLTKEDSESNYPFSKEEYRSYYRHTLWMVPGVKEAKALSALLKEHPVFGSGAFKIVNVAGDGDEEQEWSSALKMVRDAIGEDPDDGYTITLSCGRLTTGVTVPEWTAVFMLAGQFTTAASSYLQTIFRVQNPANINGKKKEYCSVFDFAPDRTLTVVAQALEHSGGEKSTREKVEEFLTFCPVIAMEGSQMKPYNVNGMMRQLKKAYTEMVVKSGFDDKHLYKESVFMNLTDEDKQKFKELQAQIGKTTAGKKKDKIDINSQGLDGSEAQSGNDGGSPPRTEPTREQLERRKQRELTKNLISILRGLSVRIPLLIYGANVKIKENITAEKFPDLIDKASWDEFMPKGVTKEMYKNFVKYYDQDVFVSAGLRIRQMASEADELPPTERVKRIAEIFSFFKNPDKETVLTPWRVVNMHMSECLGGYNFFNESFDDTIEDPVFVNRGTVTADTLANPDAKILEINSKTGLYPLYVAYSLFRAKMDKIDADKRNDKTAEEVWKDVAQNNVFVLCKTDMAKMITQRTLMGYRKDKINAHAFDDIIMQLKEKQEQFKKKVTRGSFWNKENGTMKFDAVVGNPPYQGTNHQQIYPYFYLLSRELAKYSSLIFPTGWQASKKANNLSKMNNKDVKCDPQIHFIDNYQNIFPGISGAEWVNMVLWEKDYNNGLEGKQKILTNGREEKVINLTIKQDALKPDEIIRLANKVAKASDFKSISTITSTRKPYGLCTDVVGKHEKYGLPELQVSKEKEDDVRVWIKSGNIMYVPDKYPFPKKTEAFKWFKVFVPYAWGNMSEKKYLGGAFSDIIIAGPNEACTETYIESGCFETYDKAEKHAKYLMTKFTRALLYVNKVSQHSTTAWDAVPIQDYSEGWWAKPISELDACLFNKYGIEKDIAEFVEKNFQPRSEQNIVKYKS